MPGLPRLRAALAPYRRRLFAAALIAAIAVNVFQFRAIDRERYYEFRAVGTYPTDDLARITFGNGGWHRQRYGLYQGLGTLAPGATVYIPTPGPYDAERQVADETASRLRVFGRVGRLVWVAAPTAAAGPGFDPTPYVVATGVGGARGAPWALAVDPARPRPKGPADPNFYLRPLVTSEGPRTSGADRAFALIRWPQAREGEEYDYQELLVETTLLPPAVRDELTR
ncbi:hypothetical protein RB614_17215 [Phytohabitans sp. ZYX-F-186]|uniref:Uncharacterized protein n=1 Tax=Phytohabitans maris TaxID=3071409 RepID=A0ABU0ZGR9_9ACTN|nr:hypothetical protein [Phytohabitans sp. ZYX-F-186]MDQ7906255.1 hypothetical protein [Phytohabitans sp. ZYX-F-186]